MSSNIKQTLEESLQDAEETEAGAVIIEPTEESGKFIQYIVNSNSFLLDFPVLSTNENTKTEASFIREYLSEYTEEVRESPSDGEGFNIILPKDDEIIELTVTMISEIWSGCESIETEIV